MLDNPNTSLNTRNIDLKKKTKHLSTFQKDYEAHPLMMHQVERGISMEKRMSMFFSTLIISYRQSGHPMNLLFIEE